MKFFSSCGPTICVAVASIALIGCANGGTYVPPQTKGQPAQYERVVNKSFDDTWTALIDYTAQTFFSIDRFEKASGLLTLSFGSTEPARFIDCGQWKASSGSGDVDMPYATFLNESYGAKLDGKMNLVVRALDATRTIVRVNARYVFAIPSNLLLKVPGRTWLFDSGGEASVTLDPTTRDARICRPTYAAERAVLDFVAK